MKKTKSKQKQQFTPLKFLLSKEITRTDIQPGSIGLDLGTQGTFDWNYQDYKDKKISYNDMKEWGDFLAENLSETELKEELEQETKECSLPGFNDLKMRSYILFSEFIKDKDFKKFFPLYEQLEHDFDIWYKTYTDL